MQILPFIMTGEAPIGVEIHAGGVRLAQVRKSRSGITVRALASAPVDAKGRGPHDTSLLEEVARTVYSLRSEGFCGKRCVVGLDSRLVRTRSVRQAHLEDDEVNKAVKLDAPSRLGFADDEPCEVAWLRAGDVRQSDEVRDELIYLGVKRAPIERLVGELAALGLQTVAVEPNFLALARAYTRTLRRESDVAVSRLIVDIGEQHSEVLVTRGRGVAFYKQVEIGAAAITRAAAEKLGLDPKTVQDLRRRRVIAAATPGAEQNLDPKVDRAIFDAVRPVMNDLAHEVTLCLRYFSVTFRGIRPDAVIVSGDEAGEPGLAQTISESAHLPCSVGRPLDGLDTSRIANLPHSRGFGSAWGAAVSLSTRTIEATASRRERVEREERAAA